MRLVAEGHFNLGLNETLMYYDVVGLDVRGVGDSSRVICDPELWNHRISLFPGSQDEYNKLVDYNKALGESCLERTGEMLRFMDTATMAKDLETVRVALGEAKLNLLAASYGSLLGATYAEAYPEKIGKLVLDGVIDHSQSESTVLMDSALAYETGFSRFANWCSNAPACPLFGRDVLQLTDELISTAAYAPIPAPGCIERQAFCRHDVTDQELLFNIQPLLTEPRLWPLLGLGLMQAAAGNATILSTNNVKNQEDSKFAARAIECLDWHHSSTSFVDVLYKWLIRRFTSQHMGGMSHMYATQINCLGWPVRRTNAQRAINIKGNPPVLLVSALYDPVTSVMGASTLGRKFDNATLIIRNGDGHLSFHRGGKTTFAIDQFFVNGTLPETGTIYDT